MENRIESIGVNEQTPREIVEELDRYIVGQDEAKRSVAIALRNRYRRSKVDDAMREEISPKNILMIGLRHSARKADYNLSAIKTANLVGMRLENNALPHCHLTIARNRGVAIFAHGANRRASEFHAHCFPPERGFFPAPMHIIPQTAPIVTRFCLKPAFP